MIEISSAPGVSFVTLGNQADRSQMSEQINNGSTEETHIYIAWTRLDSQKFSFLRVAHACPVTRMNI